MCLTALGNFCCACVRLDSVPVLCDLLVVCCALPLLSPPRQQGCPWLPIHTPATALSRNSLWHELWLTLRFLYGHTSNSSSTLSFLAACVSCHSVPVPNNTRGAKHISNEVYLSNIFKYIRPASIKFALGNSDPAAMKAVTVGLFFHPCSMDVIRSLVGIGLSLIKVAFQCSILKFSRLCAEVQIQQRLSG